jgi:hypothetical protein
VVIVYVLGLAAGIVAGYLAGGRLRHLAVTIRLRAVWLIYVGLAVQVLVAFGPKSWVPQDVRFPLVLGSYGLVAVWLVVNGLKQRGAVQAAVLIIGLGTLLNIAAIAPNGGIPVSDWALEKSGQSMVYTEKEGEFFKHVRASENTYLNVLGDAIPVPFVARVISVGDIAILLGIAITLAVGMRRPNPAGSTRAKDVES